MLRTSGYKLLNDQSDDPEELKGGPNDLKVRGRGAFHQVDALGELTYVPPFSLPLRMFVEAKCHKTKRVGIEVLRNAHGVIHDVNQNWASSADGWVPRSRYHYLYSVFSTSGFAEDAQQYALAHQIVLVDLSTSEFDGLQQALARAADRFRGLLASGVWGSIGLKDVRRRLRQVLGTAAVNSEAVDRLPDPFEDEVEKVVTFLSDTWSTSILLGFPAAPFVLAFTATDVASVLASLVEDPVQQVNLRQTTRGEVANQWIVNLAGGSELRFNLPSQVQNWISQDDGRAAVSRRSVMRSQFLSDITLVYAGEEQAQLFKLIYQSSDWKRGLQDPEAETTK